MSITNYFKSFVAIQLFIEVLSMEGYGVRVPIVTSDLNFLQSTTDSQQCNNKYSSFKGWRQSHIYASSSGNFFKSILWNIGNINTHGRVNIDRVGFSCYKLTKYIKTYENWVGSKSIVDIGEVTSPAETEDCLEEIGAYDSGSPRAYPPPIPKYNYDGYRKTREPYTIVTEVSVRYDPRTGNYLDTRLKRGICENDVLEEDEGYTRCRTNIDDTDFYIQKQNLSDVFFYLPITLSYNLYKITTMGNEMRIRIGRGGSLANRQNVIYEGPLCKYYIEGRAGVFFDNGELYMCAGSAGCLSEWGLIETCPDNTTIGVPSTAGEAVKTIKDITTSIISKWCYDTLYRYYANELISLKDVSYISMGYEGDCIITRWNNGILESTWAQCVVIVGRKANINSTDYIGEYLIDGATRSYYWTDWIVDSRDPLIEHGPSGITRHNGTFISINGLRLGNNVAELSNYVDYMKAELNVMAPADKHNFKNYAFVVNVERKINISKPSTTVGVASSIANFFSDVGDWFTDLFPDITSYLKIALCVVVGFLILYIIYKCGCCGLLWRCFCKKSKTIIKRKNVYLTKDDTELNQIRY